MRSPAVGDGLLVIGYGSSLRGDDGAGPEAARRLAELGFDALAVHQLTPEIAERIAAARTVVFLDADAGLPPGEVSVEPLHEDKVTTARPMEHHASPTALLHLARVVYGAAPEAWLIGMGVSSLEIGEGLSKAAGQAVSRAIETVLRGPFAPVPVLRQNNG